MTVKCHFHFQMVYSFVWISPQKHFFESILVTPKGFQPSWQLPLVPQLIHYTYTQLDKYQKMQMPPSLGKGSHIFIQQTLFEHLLCPGMKMQACCCPQEPHWCECQVTGWWLNTRCSREPQAVPHRCTLWITTLTAAGEWKGEEDGGRNRGRQTLSEAPDKTKGTLA